MIHSVKNITDSVVYVGCDDVDLDLFEGQYKIPNGMAYNSYVILNEKICIIDTADERVSEQWIENVKTALNGMLMYGKEAQQTKLIQTAAHAIPSKANMKNHSVESKSPERLLSDMD